MIRMATAAAMVVACWVYGAAGADASDVLRVGGAVVKWAPSAPGQATVITYATLTQSYVMPENAATLSPDNCGAMRAFGDVVTGSPSISEAAAKRALRSAFSAWESVAAVSFVEVDDVKRANIIIGASASPKGRAFANLSFSGQKERSVEKAIGQQARPALPAFDLLTIGGTAIAPIAQAYVCLNPKAPWKLGFDGNLDVYDLRHTFMHEIGHAIGLDHPSSSGVVMAYRYDERVNGLQSSDVTAARKLYGAPLQD